MGFFYRSSHFTISLEEANAVGSTIKWRSRMTKLKCLSAALIAAATFATPAMARETHISVRHLAENANASTMPGVEYIGDGDRFRGYEGHDVWGHWGTYYGPMLPSIP
jgi:hypothetical protein